MAEPVSNVNEAGSPVGSGEDRLNVAGMAPMPPALPGMNTDDDSYRHARANTRLNTAAERVGGAVGSAVGSMRRAGSRLRVVGGRARTQGIEEIKDTADRIRSRVPEITSSAGETVDQWQEEAAERFDELRQTTRERFNQLSSDLRAQTMHARRRAAYLMNEYPIQSIAAFGALAFVVGATLRIWRSNGD